jgi:hypothetical protein
MGTIDLSRAAFDAKKRYTSVRMQQGRVLLDDDFNDAERIPDEDERRALLDISVLRAALTTASACRTAASTRAGRDSTSWPARCTWALRVWNPGSKTSPSSRLAAAA